MTPRPLSSPGARQAPGESTSDFVARAMREDHGFTVPLSSFRPQLWWRAGELTSARSIQRREALKEALWLVNSPRVDLISCNRLPAHSTSVEGPPSTRLL